MLTYTMGGPSIDVGEPHTDDHRILRYTPPVPEFEVMILSLDPGDMCKLKNPGVPAILLVLEGTGKVDGQVLRPGRSYVWYTETEGNLDGDAAGGAATIDAAVKSKLKSLTFTVDEMRRGALKVAIAHVNLHVNQSTCFRRVESNQNLYTMHGMLPYMGRTGGTPSPGYLKSAYSDVTDGTPAIPKL
eukprot:Sro330_g118940.1 Mannose-6-phosphate isomerase (187) ;mRNA; r:36948-37508